MDQGGREVELLLELSKLIASDDMPTM